MSGNARFSSSSLHYPNQNTWRREELTAGQAPFGAILSCADSRVPPELIFDCGLGDLFVVRTAGHVLGPQPIGSVEYGVAQCDTPLLVVLGHQGCGAVAAALASHSTGEVPGGFVRDVVKGLAPAIEATAAAGSLHAGAVIAEHTRRTVRALVETSDTVSARLDAGTMCVVGMTYSLDDGSVTLVEAIGQIDDWALAALLGRQDAASARVIDAVAERIDSPADEPEPALALV